MAVVSRLQLNHPALGTAGGAGLHSSIESLYEKIGDNVADRWFELTDFDQTETVDLVHNFETDISNLRYDLYNYTGGEWVRLTASTTPARSAFSIVEKSGSEGTTLQITNNTGGDNLTFAVCLTFDSVSLADGDVKDVDTSGVADGQALVYDSGTSKFIPGTAGDLSFKLKSITDPNAILRGGYLFLDDGRELATYDGAGTASTDYGTDLTLNLDTIFGGNPVDATTYYLYISLATLGAEQTQSDTGRKVYNVIEANFVLSTTEPEDTDLSLFVPIGFVRSATTGTVWSGAGAAFSDLAAKKHGVAGTAIASPSQTGQVNTIAQSFGGVKTVEDGLLVGSEITTPIATNYLHVSSSGATNVQISRVGATASAPILFFAKGRGTPASPTVSSLGDEILRISGMSHDGTNFVEAASIKMVVDGTPGTTDMPGRIIFNTSPDGSATPAEAVRIDSSRNLILQGSAVSSTSITHGTQGIVLRNNDATVTNNDYIPPIRFETVDNNLTTTNPKTVAWIAAKLVDSYNVDTASGAQLEFATSPAAGGASVTPTVRMTINNAGALIQPTIDGVLHGAALSGVGLNLHTNEASVSSQVRNVAMQLWHDSATAANGVQCYFAKTNGTTPTADDEVIADFNFYGYDTASGAIAARIRVAADGEFGTAGDSSDSPGRIEFATSPNATSTLVTAMTIDSTQVVTTHSGIKVDDDVNQSTLNYYRTENTSLDWQFNGTAPGSAVSSSTRITRIGNFVHFHLATARATTGTGSTILSSVAWPSWAWPVRTTVIKGVHIRNGGASDTTSIGVFQINSSDGIASIYRDLSLTAFSNAGEGGVQTSFSGTYAIE